MREETISEKLHESLGVFSRQLRGCLSNDENKSSSLVRKSLYSLMHNSSSQLLKLKLKNFDGEPLELPERTSMFIKTVPNRSIVRSKSKAPENTALWKSQRDISDKGYSEKI